MQDESDNLLPIRMILSVVQVHVVKIQTFARGQGTL